MMDRATAAADLKTRLDVIRTVEGNNQAAIDTAKARNILHENPNVSPIRKRPMRSMRR